MSQDNPWAWWQAALEGNVGPMHEGLPEQGYYRTRFKGGQWEPVALWRDDDGCWLAQRGDRMVDPADAWNFCRTHPVTHEAWRKAMDGGGWDDEPPAPAMGHNLPADPFEALKLEYQAEKELAAELLKKEVKTEDQASQIAILSKRVASVAKKATDLHKVEKQPHLDASRAVDDKYRYLKEDPADLSKQLKRHLDPFLLEQQRIERERQEAARREEERLRREAEEAARKAAEADQQSQAERQAAVDRARQLEQEAAAKAKEAEAKNASAGRTGARVSLRTFVDAKVNDYQAAATALVLMKHPDILAVIDQLAKRAVTAGQSLPGVERVETQRAA
ncbi:hypothetical protein GB928_018360 [Shinella curvata]|uniref:Uncharacterized protein n=1 Tax=Shinella curvata TaxID=1817964 RepID=A0ABT8XJ22_9HYPH|nr:hypothetical protein [Shinella curvata]MCJ8053823.1 hypothetical protein [Shinella curvata]MDO6123155.1 hypothetical protein [Shinella curvata]